MLAESSATRIRAKEPSQMGNTVKRTPQCPQWHGDAVVFPWRGHPDGRCEPSQSRARSPRREPADSDFLPGPLQAEPGARDGCREAAGVPNWVVSAFGLSKG